MTPRRSDGTDKQRDGGNATEESRAEQRDAEGERKKNVLRFAACHALQISREMRGFGMKRTEIGTAEGVRQLEVAGDRLWRRSD